MESETIFVQQYPKYGYEVRTEMVSHLDGSEPIEMRNVYTASGAYIGNRRNGVFLCEEKGIKPELIDSEHKVCSIGFCEAEQKWYGWSHRAIFGFGIGSQVKKGDCGYVPSKVEELIKELEKNDELCEIIDDETIRIGIEMHDIIGENEDGSLKLSDEAEIERHAIKTGHGRWTAKTLDDARQMAMDFANGVA
jgi:hypothetical protein